MNHWCGLRLWSYYTVCVNTQNTAKHSETRRNTTKHDEILAAYCSDFAPTHSLWFKISGRKGRPPTISFAWIVRPMNALQLCPRQFSHSCYGWDATSENRSKISDFAPTRSLWSKISGTWSHPPPIIFAPLTVFTQTFFKQSAFLMEVGRFAFLRPPLANLGATRLDTTFQVRIILCS